MRASLLACSSAAGGVSIVAHAAAAVRFGMLIEADIVGGFAAIYAAILVLAFAPGAALLSAGRSMARRLAPTRATGTALGASTLTHVLTAAHVLLCATRGPSSLETILLLGSWFIGALALSSALLAAVLEWSSRRWLGLLGLAACLPGVPLLILSLASLMIGLG